MRKKAGVCVHCGEEDAYTMNGRSLCSECAEKWATWNRERKKKSQDARERAKQSQKKIYNTRREQGLCPYCGGKPAIGYITCDKCRAKSRKRANKCNERKYGIRPRGEYGMCWTCNKNEALPGMRLCQTCYDKSAKALDIANKTRIEKGIYPWWSDKGRKQNE